MILLETKDNRFLKMHFHLQHTTHSIDMYSVHFILGVDDAHEGRVYSEYYDEWSQFQQWRYEAGRQYYFEFLKGKMNVDSGC